jgi:excisionase family DNA binding protein
VLAGLLMRITVAQSAIVAQLAVADANEPARPQSEQTVARLLTAQEMAAQLNVPESKVRADARAGRIPCVMVGRYMRFRPDEVERAIDSGA